MHFTKIFASLALVATAFTAPAPGYGPDAQSDMEIVSRQPIEVGSGVEAPATTEVLEARQQRQQSQSQRPAPNRRPNQNQRPRPNNNVNVNVRIIINDRRGGDVFIDVQVGKCDRVRSDNAVTATIRGDNVQCVLFSGPSCGGRSSKQLASGRTDLVNPINVQSVRCFPVRG